MRFNEQYRALLNKINVQKGHYSEKEMVYSNELEHNIQLATEKKKKWSIRIVIYAAVAVIILGWIARMLVIIEEKWLIWIAIIVMIIIFLVLTGFEMYYFLKLKKFNKQKEKEQSEKVDIRNTIFDLNNQISALVVSSIILNDHYYELLTLNTEEEKINKFQEYTKDIISAINQKYNFHITYSEYQEFYRDYERYQEELERTYEK